MSSRRNRLRTARGEEPHKRSTQGSHESRADPVPKRRGKKRGRHPHKHLSAVGLCRLPPGRHADGNGLYLFVRSNGACQWVQRVTIQGRRVDLGLGPWPLVSLAEARRLAIENLLRIRAGGNPKADAAREKGPTVRELFEIVIANRRTAWKDKQKTELVWRRDFNKYIFPALGDKPIATVTVEDLCSIVRPHWGGRNSKGHVLRQNLEGLLGCAVALGYRLDNPAVDLRRILPRVRTRERHQPSLPYPEVPKALEDWQDLGVPQPAELALLFIVLTAARLSEVTKARWNELDLDDCVWRLPEERMKAGKAHAVPLSIQAMEVLRRAKALKGDGSLVFPVVGRDGKVRPPSQDMMSYWLRKLGRKSACGRHIVVHGFRGSFRVWSIEVARARREIAEPALAHGESDATVRAYTEGADPFDDRARLMQEWADYILPMSGRFREG